MRTPQWVRGALDGYRWLWRAHVRWCAGPVWWAAVVFAVRLIVDLARGALTALEACANPAVCAVPAATTIEGRGTMAIPANIDFSANERFKAGFDSWFWMSMMAAVLIHFATFAFWPELSAADISIDRTVLKTVDMIGEVDIPPPPEPLKGPALPVITDVDLGDEATIGLTDWKDNPVDQLPPPPEIEQVITRAENIVPFTLPPAVKNTDQVVRAMRREYPSVLRDAGIGGNVRVIFSIDENGRVLDTELEESSGYEALDAAALAVADVIEFSPAMNRDQYVAVRVVFPIAFRVDDAGR